MTKVIEKQIEQTKQGGNPMKECIFEKYIKLREKHPYIAVGLVSALSGLTTSLIFNIILLLARKLMM